MTHKAFEPARLGPLTLANHIVMAPMTRSRALGNVPNEMMVEYYRQRASAGLIVTEGTAPAAEGLGYPRIPGLFNHEQVAHWRRITDAVHERGARIFLQVMHTGRIFHSLNLPAGADGVAPSAIPADGVVWTDQEQLKPHGTPRALNARELERVRDEFVHSAKLAVEAGFDGIELHGANGYLLEQFLNPATNQRDDQYGGSVENRARFVLEVTRAVAEAIGPERTAIRLSPWNMHGDMPHYPEIHETYSYLAAELQKIGVVYVHLIKQQSMGAPGVSADTLHAIRQIFKNTLIINGGFDTVEAIDAALANGDADLVSIGRPFIANPDLVERLKRGAPLADGNQATWFAAGPTGFSEGFIDYPNAA
jgi:N-ethylmaleimide reductase